jgi:hypothetical protein
VQATAVCCWIADEFLAQKQLPARFEVRWQKVYCNFQNLLVLLVFDAYILVGYWFSICKYPFNVNFVYLFYLFVNLIELLIFSSSFVGVADGSRVFARDDGHLEAPMF